MTVDGFRSRLCPIMGDSFSEHEMITISRAFNAECEEEKYNRESIRYVESKEGFFAVFSGDFSGRLRWRSSRGSSGTTGSDCWSTSSNGMVTGQENCPEKTVMVFFEPADCRSTFCFWRRSSTCTYSYYLIILKVPFSFFYFGFCKHIFDFYVMYYTFKFILHPDIIFFFLELITSQITEGFSSLQIL